MTPKWDSIASMRRIAHGLGITAVVLFFIGLGTLALQRIISTGALVLGTAAVLCTMFAWFRLEHLRDLERQDR